jgi:hypothetical protein
MRDESRLICGQARHHSELDLMTKSKPARARRFGNRETGSLQNLNWRLVVVSVIRERYSSHVGGLSETDECSLVLFMCW